MMIILHQSSKLVIRRLSTVRLLSVNFLSNTSSESGTQQKNRYDSFDSSKSSTGTRTFFAFQKDGSNHFEPFQPPEKPKDFKNQYLRRPLYGFALKGDRSYREINVWIVKAVMGAVIINLLFMGYFYYQQWYVSTEEERKERYRKTTMARMNSPEAIESRELVRPFVGLSTLGGFFFYPEHGNTSKADREKIPDIYSILNNEDIVDAAQVLRRSDTGREDVHKKSLAEFDEELRK